MQQLLFPLPPGLEGGNGEFNSLAEVVELINTELLGNWISET